MENESDREREEEIVELTKVQGEFEARLIKGALDAEGIESMIRAGIVQNVLPFTVNGLGVMKILVHRKDLERAEEVLRSTIPLDENGVDEVRSEDDEPVN